MDSARLALTGATTTDQGRRTHHDPRIRAAESDPGWREIAFPTPGPDDGAPISTARQVVKSHPVGDFADRYRRARPDDGDHHWAGRRNLRVRVRPARGDVSAEKVIEDGGKSPAPMSGPK